MGFDAEKYWKSPANLPRSLTKHEIGPGPVLLCNNSNFYFKLISTEGGLGIEYKILKFSDPRSLSEFALVVTREFMFPSS